MLLSLRGEAHRLTTNHPAKAKKISLQGENVPVMVKKDVLYKECMCAADFGSPW